MHGAERRRALHALEGLRDLVDVLDVRVQVRLLAKRRRADLKLQLNGMEILHTGWATIC